MHLILYISFTEFIKIFRELLDKNKQLQRNLRIAQDEILEFPRREEEIVRKTEKIMRLKTMSLRQEDNKIRA